MSDLYVAFTVAGTQYAIPAADVLYMETFTVATRVPGAPAYVAGLVQIRDRVVPVVDLRVRFELSATPPTLDTRVIVVVVRDRPVGLLVDSAREVVKIADDQVRAPPRVLEARAETVVRAVAQVGARLFILLDPDKVAHADEEQGSAEQWDEGSRVDGGPG